MPSKVQPMVNYCKWPVILLPYCYFLSVWNAHILCSYVVIPYLKQHLRCTKVELFIWVIRYLSHTTFETWDFWPAYLTSNTVWARTASDLSKNGIRLEPYFDAWLLKWTWNGSLHDSWLPASSCLVPGAHLIQPYRAWQSSKGRHPCSCHSWCFPMSYFMRPMACVMTTGLPRLAFAQCTQRVLCHTSMP